MVSMCFSCTVCWGEIGTGKSLVVWVDTAGCTQAEALGSVQEEASQPEPWGGDHRKRPGDCIRVTVGSDLREDKLAGGMGIPGKNRQAFKKSKNQPQSIFRIQRTSPFWLLWRMKRPSPRKISPSTKPPTPLSILLWADSDCARHSTKMGFWRLECSTRQV